MALKFIHTADVHLGSQLKLDISEDKIKLRRLEIRSTFKNIVELAKRENATAIILSGDVFDGARALKKDKEFFYSVIKSSPEIDFLYLRGNHDILESYLEELDNLKLFSDEWTYYNYGNVVISGIEMTNLNSASLYQTLNLSEGNVNITMLHGQVADSSQNGLVNLKKLKGKNIDYLALGHVHSYMKDGLDERGVYAYSGCPEGRGFDEAGEKGVILLETTQNGIASTFIPLAKRTIRNFSVDCTGLADSYEVSRRVREVCKMNRDNLYRVDLVGEVDFDIDGIAGELKEFLKGECFALSVKEHLKRKVDLDALKGDLSLKGEFLRAVYSSELSDEDKADVASLGIKVLTGREI